MTTYFVTIVLMLQFSALSGYYVEENYHLRKMESIEECLRMKHQREFLPPPYANSAEVYFCMER